jgi:hypothetical protein
MVVSTVQAQVVDRSSVELLHSFTRPRVPPFDHKIFFQKIFSSPSGCLTGVDRVSLEMITKFLFAIQAATRCFRPQTQFPSRFARQSEFLF